MILSLHMFNSEYISGTVIANNNKNKNQDIKAKKMRTNGWSPRIIYNILYIPYY